MFRLELVPDFKRFVYAVLSRCQNGNLAELVMCLGTRYGNASIKKQSL